MINLLVSEILVVTVALWEGITVPPPCSTSCSGEQGPGNPSVPTGPGAAEGRVALPYMFPTSGQLFLRLQEIWLCLRKFA